MKIRIPPRRIRERFLIIYELEGCRKAVDFLTKYYGVRRMRVILNGRKVGESYVAYYMRNRAYFTKRGLTKRTVLHELYHHLVYASEMELSETKEEAAANRYARDFLA